MITCRDLAELVTDYLEGKLSLGDRLRFQLHLGLCVHCRAYLRQLEQTSAALHDLQEEPAQPPPEVEAELLRRFQGWKQRRP
jgi:predicted anti-sigma-YlaC factor YlaD